MVKLCRPCITVWDGMLLLFELISLCNKKEERLPLPFFNKSEIFLKINFDLT